MKKLVILGVFLLGAFAFANDEAGCASIDSETLILATNDEAGCASISGESLLLANDEAGCAAIGSDSTLTLA